MRTALVWILALAAAIPAVHAQADQTADAAAGSHLQL